MYYILAFCAGMAFTIQAGVNSQLRQATDNPIQAAFISFLGGAITLLLCLLVGSKFILPSFSLSDVHWWQLTGGLFGAFFVYAIILTGLKIGSANMFSLIVAGQLLLAVLFDHYGLLGFNIHKLTLLRFWGILMLVAGVFIIQKN